MLAGLRGDDSIAELCHREGLHQNLYDRWSKDFLEAGKKRLAGDSERQTSRENVSELRKEATQLKETLPELLLENRLLTKYEHHLAIIEKRACKERRKNFPFSSPSACGGRGGGERESFSLAI